MAETGKNQKISFFRKTIEYILLSVLFGLPLAATLSESFGFPELHHGSYERFLLVATILCGPLYLWGIHSLKRHFRRCFSTPSDILLTISLIALFAVAVWSWTSPYTYQEIRFGVSLKQEKGQQARLMGIYPEAGKSMPLVGIYSFEPFDRTADYDIDRDFRSIPLGSQYFKKMFFSVSRHKLENGVYIKTTRNLPLKIECAGEKPYFATTPQNNDYIQLRIPRSTSTLSPFDSRIADLAALPGILLFSLLCAVYLRKIAWLAIRCPKRLSVHFALLLTFAGFVLTYQCFELEYSNDPVHQFRQGLRGIYQEWHPPVMAFIWIHLTRFFEFITGYFSPAEPFCLFLRLPYWLGFFLLGKYAAKRAGFSGVLLVMLAAYAPFFFREYQFIFSYAWKDSLLVSCYVLAFGIILNLKQGSLSIQKGICWLIALLFFIIGTGVRSNAVLAAIPLSCFFLLPFFELGNWRGILKVLAGGAIVFIVTVSSIYILHYPVLKTIPQTPLSYPMFKEILAMRALSGDREWPEFLEQKFRDDFDRRYDYSKHNGGTDGFLHGSFRIVNLPRENYDQLKAFWIRKVQEHPNEYLEQKWNSFYRTMRVYKQPVSLLNPWHLFWASAIASIFSAIFFIRAKKRRRTECLAVFLLGTSALLYLSTYYLFAFVADFRYLSWTLYGGMLAGAFFAMLLRPED